MENINFDSLKRRRDLRIILPVFLVSIIACIDRVNISYAKLTMTQTLSWLSPEVYGFGAGIFFAGYLLLEIPGSLFAAKFSASKWISRIMFTWGAVDVHGPRLETMDAECGGAINVDAMMCGK